MSPKPLQIDEQKIEEIVNTTGKQKTEYVHDINRITLYSVVHFHVEGQIMRSTKQYCSDQNEDQFKIRYRTIVIGLRSVHLQVIFSENKSNLSFQTDMLSFKEGIPSAETAIIKPNLNSIRKILGGDGTDQQRKVVEENTGLIPKYYKASIIITLLN